jgi:hypothetical protein
VEQKPIYSHKVILGLRSHYFKELFDKPEGIFIEFSWRFLNGIGNITISIEDANYTLFRELLHFCYSPVISIAAKEDLANLRDLNNSKYKVIELSSSIEEKMNSFDSTQKLLETSAAIQTEMAPGIKTEVYS